MDGPTDGPMDVPIDGPMDAQTDGPTDGQSLFQAYLLQPETLEKLIFQLLHFFQFFLNFSWLNELIEWANFFFVVDLWSVATLCKKIVVVNSILAFFLKS